MSNLGNTLKINPAIVLAILGISGSALAEKPPIEEINEDTSAIEQVTSVSQLSDVQPTDWAFQALQSLVERYGCIAGYPNGTYRGNRAMTRYEFAAGLNACMDKVNQLIAAGNNQVKKTDLITLQKLLENFSNELATLRGKVDSLEARTAKLEANQFSTITKLQGEAIFAVTSIAAGKNALGNKIDRVPVLATRTRLNFESSFTGKDFLRTRLQVNNLDAFSNRSTLTPEGDLSFSAGLFESGSNEIQLDELSYIFPIGEKTQGFVATNATGSDSFTDTINPYFDGDGGSGSLSRFGTRHSIYYLNDSIGVGLKHQFNNKLELSLGYRATSANIPSQGNGLFNGAYGALAQLTIKPSDSFKFGLTYINAYNTDLGTGSNRANLRSVLASNPGFFKLTGTTYDLPISSNSYGIESSWRVSSKFVLGGWVGYTNNRILSTLQGTINRGDLNIWNWAVTLGFPDLGKKGNFGGIILGMEPKVTSVSNGLKPVIGKDPSTSLHIEALYQYQVNDNIAITPGVIWLTSPDHNSNNDDIVIGVVRTTFSF